MGRSAMTFMPPKQRRSQGSLERNLYTGGSLLPLHGAILRELMTGIAYVPCTKAEARSSCSYWNAVLLHETGALRSFARPEARRSSTRRWFQSRISWR